MKEHLETDKCTISNYHNEIINKYHLTKEEKNLVHYFYSFSYFLIWHYFDEKKIQWKFSDNFQKQKFWFKTFVKIIGKININNN